MTPARLSSRAPLTLCALRSSITLPFPHDVDIAPQLVAVALAQAALAGALRALDSAHPVLGVPPRPDWDPDLTDTEELAAVVLDTASHLSTLLRDYEAAVLHDIGDRDELQSPF